MTAGNELIAVQFKRWHTFKVFSPLCVAVTETNEGLQITFIKREKGERNWDGDGRSKKVRELNKGERQTGTRVKKEKEKKIQYMDSIFLFFLTLHLNMKKPGYKVVPCEPTCGSKIKCGRPFFSWIAMNSSWFPGEKAARSRPSGDCVLKLNWTPKEHRQKERFSKKQMEHDSSGFHQCQITFEESNLSQVCVIFVLFLQNLKIKRCYHSFKQKYNAHSFTFYSSYVQFEFISICLLAL